MEVPLASTSCFTSSWILREEGLILIGLQLVRDGHQWIQLETFGQNELDLNLDFVRGAKFLLFNIDRLGVFRGHGQCAVGTAEEE